MHKTTQHKKKDKQGQFIIQPKTKPKTGLVFMESQNKQTQRSKLRIPVLDKHFCICIILEVSSVAEQMLSRRVFAH